MDKVSMSHEDYLEAIIMLGGSPDAPIRSVDIAKKMDVSKASVNKAVGLLKSKGYVDQPYYGDVTLTDEGYSYGQAIYKRHRYLTAFLSKGLGIEQKTAEDEACLMEHAISDDSFEKWVAYIDSLGLVED
ncbi:MAG TPA: metal-dependent transcriptional regulator [Eggerthellaceae bacterium]|nr:metal-dependent transcriptional regulator [Eggerthellaceae bacterium]